MKLSNDVQLQTLANVSLDVTRVGTGIIIGRHAVVTGRIVADNGIAYVIDRLLWPRESKWDSGSSDPGGRLTY